MQMRFLFGEVGGRSERVSASEMENNLIKFSRLLLFFIFDEVLEKVFLCPPPPHGVPFSPKRISHSSMDFISSVPRPGYDFTAI
jgi:hypothetical protein